MKHSPSTFFQPRNDAGSAPAVRRTLASHVWSLYRQLDQTQWLDPVEVQQRQLAQLRRLLHHCVAHSPYYRRVWQASPIQIDDIHSLDAVRCIPILGRRVYQEQFDQIVARTLPPGMRMDGTLSTSGTSGVPIQVQQTNVTQLWWLAFAMRDFEWCGIDPRGTLAAIRATGKEGGSLQRLLDGVSLKTWGPPLDSMIDTGPCHLMDVHQNPRRQWEWLQAVDPDYLLSFPSNAECLASLANESPTSLSRLRVIQLISEELTDAQRTTIESAFGVPVKNTYSASEAGYIASPCPQGDRFHVHAENVLLEVLDEHDEHCEPGESGRVVLTALHNFATPFIRYDIMDDAVLGPPNCPCGRGLPTLLSVSGKRRPLLTLPSGAVKNSSQLAIGLRQIGGFHQFQIVQITANHLRILVVPDRNWSEPHRDRIRQLAHSFFEVPIEGEVIECDRIQPTAGGKVIDVVRM